jgi:hypothetical protein
MKQLLIIVLILISFLGNGQKTISYSNQQWFQYYNLLKINPKLTLLSDVGYRYISAFSYRSLYLTRIGLGYEIKPGFRVSGRIAHLGVYNLGQLNKVEFRGSQGLLHVKNTALGKMIQHFRIEERIFKDILNGKIQSENEFNFRFRYQFSLTFPLLKLSSKDPDKKLLFSIGNEIFINSGKNITYNIYNQNRILIGPVVHLNSNLFLNLLYCHQFKSKNLPNDYNQDYVMWIKLFHKINLHKEKGN